MAVSTYAELQTAVAAFVNRDDLTAIIPTFIALAEAQIQRDVRHWRMHERAVTSITTRYVALPGNWVETIRFTVDANGYRELRLLSEPAMQGLRACTGNTGGVPQYYAHIAGEIEVYPSPSGAYTGELVYVEKIPALSDATTYNWLLQEAPDVYLYGALIQSAPYLSEDGRAALWAGLYQSAVMALNAAGERAQYSGTGLVMRAAS